MKCCCPCLLATLAGAETFVDIALFGVKKHELLRRFLPFAKGTQYRDMEGDHGRIETRTTTVFHDVAWLQKRHDWPGLKNLVMVESVREIGERIERENRYYVVYRPSRWGLRSHWAVENSATARQGQALDTRGAQGRCMGR